MPGWSETGGDLNLRGELRVVGGHGASVDGDAAVRGALTLGRGVSAQTLTRRTVGRLSTPYVYVPPGFGQRWFTARGEGGSRQVKGHYWGDSIAAGVGTSAPVTLSTAGRTITALQSQYGDGGSGWLPAGTIATLTGTWTAGMGMGGCQVRATAAASITWTGLRGTTIRLFHRNANITGVFRWRVDGGEWRTVTPPTGFSQDPGADTVTGLSTAAHTVNVEWVSGTVDIWGVEALYDTGVSLYRFAQSGRAASDYTLGATQKIAGFGITNASANATTASPGSFTNSMTGRYPILSAGTTGMPADATLTVTSATAATLSANATATRSNQLITLATNPPSNPQAVQLCADPFLAAAIGRPDFVVVQLGANDPAGVYNDANTFREGLARILRIYSGTDSVTYTPDVVFVIEHIGTWFDVESEYAAMAAVVADVAASANAAVVDAWGMGLRSWKHWSNLGYFADQIHLTDAGAAAQAQPVIDILTGEAA
jgi:lysophospholipase L1-like esterase